MALILIPQQGQIYFLVLVFFGGSGGSSKPPLFVPVVPVVKVGISFLFIRMSLKS